MRKLSSKTIDKIRKLREDGYSLPEIKNTVKVGYGTVYRYIQNVKIKPENIKTWRGKYGGSKKRQERAEAMALKKAREIVTELSNKEKIIFLSALYWGEGGKSDFNLTNTDPDLIRIFAKGLTEVFGISKDRLRMSIRIYEDLDKEKSLNFWSEITGIPITQTLGINILTGKKKGKLAYGMCRLRIKKGGDMLKYMKALCKEVVSSF